MFQQVISLLVLGSLLSGVSACTGSLDVSDSAYGHSLTKQEIIANAPADCNAWEYDREAATYTCHDLSTEDQAKQDSCIAETITVIGDHSADTSDMGAEFWKMVSDCTEAK